MRAKSFLASAVSGVIWAIFVALIVRERSFWGNLVAARWYGCLAGPFVGMLVYGMSRWCYQRRWWLRAIWGVLIVYFASAIYGMILAFLARFFQSNPGPVIEVLMPVFPFWWGITLIPPLWLLFGASILNQELVRRFERTAE